MGTSDDADHRQHAAHGPSRVVEIWYTTSPTRRDGVGQAGHAVQQRAVIGIKGDAGGGPDQGDDALGHHGAVKDGAALLLAGDAAGHHGGLGGMEAGNAPQATVTNIIAHLGRLSGCTAASGRPRGQLRHVGAPEENGGASDAEGHDDEADTEDGIELAE